MRDKQKTTKPTCGDVSFIMYSYNTLAETMMAYRLVRPFYEYNEFVLVDDGSSDGSEAWAFGCLSEKGMKLDGQIDLDDHFRAWQNTTGHPLGRKKLIDLGIKISSSPMVSVFRYGMECSANYLSDLLVQWVDGTVNPVMMSKKDYLIKGKELFL